MTTALIGADWASDPGSGSGAGRWTAGLAVGHSRGTGGYRSEAGAGGIDATLTGVYPYAGLTLTDRLSVWTMGRRGNPYDNAMMESFMKTLKVEGVYPMAFESEKDVARHLPRFIDSYHERRLHSALGYMSPNRFEEKQSRKPVKSAA